MSISCSAEGGIPKRLTWHPGVDLSQGFAPDGASVYFISTREHGDAGKPQALPRLRRGRVSRGVQDPLDPSGGLLSGRTIHRL